MDIPRQDMTKVQMLSYNINIDVINIVIYMLYVYGGLLKPLTKYETQIIVAEFSPTMACEFIAR
jgi:hypothetical protein